MMEKTEKLEQGKSGFEAIIGEVASTDIIVYEQLNASNDKAAKAEFLENDELEHPRNEYGNLKIEKVVENRKKLSEIRKEAASSWLTDKEQRLLYALIEDNEKKNDFLLANYAYQTAETPEEKRLASEWHRQANEALYGKPDEGIFYALLDEKLSTIKPETPEEEMDYQKLIKMIGDIPEIEHSRFKPKAETVSRFSEIIQDFFGGFLDHLPEDKEEYTSEEMVATINDILGEEFGGDTGYSAAIDEKAANASANHVERSIKFPEGKIYSKAKAKALICHELGTHVMRAIPYMDHPVRAFSNELPENETFDEGVAKCVEQAINGKYEDSGIDHYINIGLANFKGKNFRDVYEIQMLLKKLTHAKTDAVLNGVQRCFRGTGELPNNKDLAYYNGSNQVWQYIEEHLDDPELMDTLFLSGKTATLKKDQERLVYETKVGGI